MAANLKRGLRRLAIAILIPWLLTWGIVFATSLNTLNDLRLAYANQNRDVMQQVRKYGGATPESLETLKNTGQHVAVATTWVRLSAELGLGGPVVAAGIVALAIWVRRGFHHPERPTGGE